MSEPPKKKPRITEDLQTLGRIIHKPNTPKQRSTSAKSTPNKDVASASAGANRISVRTPGSAAMTPSARTPTASARRSGRRGAPPTTPHAIRAQQQRRNVVMASGGTRRRRSGLMQRETPRDDLRALSRLLAKNSAPAATPAAQPAVTQRRRRSSLVDADDSPALDRAPRLSLNPRDLDDDSFHERPPRLSGTYDSDDNDDDNELEQRRRALLGRDRQSLTSFVDPSLMDVTGLGAELDDEITEQGKRFLDQDMSIHVPEEDLDENQTAELRALLEAQRRESGIGEETEITNGEPTFLFKIPERSRLSLAPPVPRTPDQGGDGVEEEEGYEDVVEGDADAGAEMDYDDDDDDNDLAPQVEDYDDGNNEEDLPLREMSVPLADNEPALSAAATSKAKAPHQRLPREVKVSRYGIEYPTFPPAVVKRLANTFSKAYGGSGKLGKDALAAIQQASDWFFEQVGEDVADYAGHAGRKTVEEGDVVMLMKRQRLLNQNTTLFSLASKYLPRELLKDVRMPPQQAKGKKRKRAAPRKRVSMEVIEEGEEDE